MRFLVIGDWGRRGSPEQLRVAEAMAWVARDRPCDFVATTGDNFYDDGVSGLEDPHWRESFEGVYDFRALDIPWLVTLGNHDHHGDTDAQIAYTLRSTRWTLPARYHQQHIASAVTSAHLLFLDTTPMMSRYRRGGVEELPGVDELDVRAQIHWLERSLEASDDEWRIVFGHHPILSGSSFHGSSSELGSQILEVLQRHEVHAYVCGHEHDLQHLEEDGMLHLLSGGGGSEPRTTGALDSTVFAAESLGFLLVELDAFEATLRFYDDDAKELHVAKRQRTPLPPAREAQPLLTR